jgi:hypothetical protein
MGNRIPGNRIVTTTITHGPNPLTVAMVAALDRSRGLSLAGLLGGLRVGMVGGSGRASRASGDLGPQQSFRGAGPVELGNLRTGRPMSLPITSVPPQGRR